jgi:hypothetical protein
MKSESAKECITHLPKLIVLHPIGSVASIGLVWLISELVVRLDLTLALLLKVRG